MISHSSSRNGPGLLTDVVSNPDHSEIVEDACHPNQFYISEAKMDLLRQPRGEFCHPCAVARDHLVTGVQSLGDKVTGCFS